MKKVFILQIVLMMFSFSACANPKNLDTETVKDITVYYINGYPQLERAIESFEKKYTNVNVNAVCFDNADELKNKMTVSKNDADVYLFSPDYIDLNKMIMTGAFEPLEKYFDSDPDFNENNYYAAVLDSGKYEGERYIAPIGISICNFYITENKILENKINIKDSMSYTEIFNLINVNDYRDEKTLKFNILPISKKPINVDKLLDYSGLELIDLENKTININNEKFKNIVDYGKLIKNNYQRYKEIVNKFTDPIDMWKECNFLLTDTLIPFLPTAVDAIYEAAYYDKQSFKMFTLPTYDDKNGYCARINLCGCINVDSDEKEYSYELLKIAMNSSGTEADDDSNVKMYAYASVNRNVNEALIAETVKNTYNYTNRGSTKIWFEPLNLDEKKYIEGVYNNIDKAVIPNVYINKIIEEYAEKYYEGEIDYDTFLNELENKLTIYINE